MTFKKGNKFGYGRSKKLLAPKDRGFIGKAAQGRFKALPVGGILRRMALNVPTEKIERKAGQGRHPGPGRKLTIEQVKEIRLSLMATKELALKFGVSVYCIRNVLLGITYQDAYHAD